LSLAWNFRAENPARTQTKEETIAWIKEKLEKYGGSVNYSYSYFTNVQVSPCSISWRHNYSWGGYADKRFNPSTAKSWEVFDSKKDRIRADSEVISQDHYNSDGSDNSRGNLGTTSVIFLKNGEADIHERMIKALLHLATFCEQGKGEAF